MDALQHRPQQEETSVAAGYSVHVESLENALVGRFRPALLVLFGAVAPRSDWPFSQGSR
jgi:hypothetical protein